MLITVIQSITLIPTLTLPFMEDFYPLEDKAQHVGPHLASVYSQWYLQKSPEA